MFHFSQWTLFAASLADMRLLGGLALYIIYCILFFMYHIYYISIICYIFTDISFKILKSISPIQGVHRSNQKSATACVVSKSALSLSIELVSSLPSLPESHVLSP